MVTPAELPAARARGRATAFREAYASDDEFRDRRELIELERFVHKVLPIGRENGRRFASQSLDVGEITHDLRSRHLDSTTG
jgi:hypothetical protein